MEKSRSLIHKWAAVGGATAGALPIGADALALAAEEVTMVIQVAAMFGVSLTKAAANALITAKFSGLVGTAIFVSLNVGYPFTIPAKIAAAVATIEALGNAVYTYYDENT